MLALVQLGVAGTVFAQQKPLSDGHLPGRNPFDDKFGAFVKDTLDEWHVPGLSIAVIDHDQVFAEVNTPVMTRWNDSNPLANTTLGLRDCDFPRHSGYPRNNMVRRFHYESLRGCCDGSSD